MCPDVRYSADPAAIRFFEQHPALAGRGATHCRADVCGGFEDGLEQVIECLWGVCARNCGLDAFAADAQGLFDGVECSVEADDHLARRVAELMLGDLLGNRT